ncbi:RICIN domain-containing protein [Longispora albida]|uniref:RICIN domain-containing protein n=1 Tax=Longispora albida TaxID=203523 RepID=UPI000363E978|nr:RICIN domain-containing protein [Longispora albida]
MAKRFLTKLLLAATTLTAVVFGSSAPANAGLYEQGYGYHGVVTLHSIHTNNYLDANDRGNGYGDAYAIPANGGIYQTWQNWYRPSDQTFVLINAATGLVLDSNSSGSVYVMASNFGNYQKWKKSYSNGGWEFRNAATNLCMGNYGSTLKTWNCDGTRAQRWL